MSQLVAYLIERVLGDQRGNIAIISAIVLPVLLGAFGLGFETADWYQTQRSLQNAADSAAVAAATNATSSYAAEAVAVAATYGFQSGVNGVNVAASNTATCPSGAANCYSVTISKPVPLYLSQLVGYRGDTTFAGAPATTVRAVAVALQGTT